MNIEKRNYSLDILKVIALLCIILAHVNPSGVIFQLRNFDVPLMIMISVLLSIKSINNKQFNYIKYIKKRIKRLIIPTWIFLTVYFAIYFVVGRLPSIKTILSSYLLIGGIGYVWVIRIYLYVAIITPIINKIYNETKKWQYIGGNIIMYLVYIIIINISSNLDGILKLLITATILDFVGYSFIVFIAIFISNLKDKQVLNLSFVFGFIFILLGIKYNFVPTQQFKYPVTLYYLSYALFVSLLLYCIFNYLNKISKLKQFKAISFLSKNSMWIYLWHILYISFVNRMFNEMLWGYVPRFIILTILAVSTTYIQNQARKQAVFTRLPGITQKIS